MKACESTKPRLAEILGVEVGERFHIAGSEGKTFWVTDKGYFETDPPQFAGSSFLLMDAINHPEYVVRAPRLTEVELELCRAFGVKYLSRDTGEHYVRMWYNKPRLLEVFMNKLYIEHGSGAWHIGTVNSDFFPSLEPGTCICVEGAGE